MQSQPESGPQFCPATAGKHEMMTAMVTAQVLNDGLPQ
jgi:hypothetical protein